MRKAQTRLWASQAEPGYCEATSDRGGELIARAESAPCGDCRTGTGADLEHHPAVEDYPWDNAPGGHTSLSLPKSDGSR